MANAIYPKWKEAVMQASANSSLGGTVKAALVDTGTYTYSAAHEFLSSLSGRVGTDQTLSNKTFVDGVLKNTVASTWPAVSGASVEAIVIYIDTGVAGTSRLVAYIDTGQTGLPVTPNGGDITVTWDSGTDGIFRL
jgi:hypothetical protein